MDTFDDKLNGFSKQNPSVISAIKERIFEMLGFDQKQFEEKEDKYELESCLGLSYEQVADWSVKHKPKDADSVLLVNFSNPEKKSKYKTIIGIVFLSGNKVLLNANYIKKVVYCVSISDDLKELFAGNESVILK